MDFVVFRENFMKHATEMQFGRPVSACLKKTDAPTGGQDKWVLLTALTKCAPDLGISHNAITVLRALLGFFPDRQLPALPGTAIVFPSNRTLGERLGGMPESTLRRHLGTLVKSGLIERRDSPNGKRFARGAADAIRVAYGFDLSPLARRATEITEHAETVSQRLAEIAAIRTSVLALRHEVSELLLAQGENDPAAGQYAELYDLTKRLLRRKLALHEITDLETRFVAIRAQLLKKINAQSTPVSTPKTTQVSGRNSQNERHIQRNKKYLPDSEHSPNTSINRQISRNSLEPAKSKTMRLGGVLDSCPTLFEFFPEEIVSWQSLYEKCGQLVPMLGIDAPVFVDAVRVMGHQHASIVVLYVLERFNSIRNPGGYIRGLTAQARRGCFTIDPVLDGLQQRVVREIVS